MIYLTSSILQLNRPQNAIILTYLPYIYIGIMHVDQSIKLTLHKPKNNVSNVYVVCNVKKDAGHKRNQFLIKIFASINIKPILMCKGIFYYIKQPLQAHIF